MSEETPFTPRLGRAGDQGASSIRRSGRRLGKAARRLAKPTQPAFTGARYGAARSTGSRGVRRAHLSRVNMRRVIVKVHIARPGRSGPGLYRAHVGYLQRDGAGRDGTSGLLYDRDSEGVDPGAFLERSENDPHQFRIIVSPEDGARMGDLKGAMRELMAQMERDTGRRLDWVAVDHHNTGHPHTHIVIRGRDARMRDVVIARDYLTRGLRAAAEDLATQRLGPRRTLEIAEVRSREVSLDRWTGLDREIEAKLEGARIDVPEASGSRARFDRSMQVGRLRHLETLGLARPAGPLAWEMREGWQQQLKRAGQRGDIIRMLAAEYSGREQGVRFVEDLGSEADRVMGTVKAYGPEDELRDTRYLLIEDFDGRVWHVPSGAADMTAPPRPGAVVELSKAAAIARPADRAIAAVADAAGGVWSEEIHLRHDPGSSPDYRLSLKRRLEALRRDGIGERLGTGEWRIDEGFVERAAGYDARRAGGIRLAVLSWVPLEQQVGLNAETWLDGIDPGGARGAKLLGELRQQRQAWLRQQGLLGAGDDQLTADQRARLRSLELGRRTAMLAAQSSRTALALQPGDTFDGKLEGHLDLASGRMAIIGNAKQFALVPWRDALGRQIGRELNIRQTATGLIWSLGTERGRGLSR